MHYKDWTTLKTAGKVAFKKIAASGSKAEHIVLEQKKYNSDTGVEYINNQEMSLAELEKEKENKTALKTKLQTEITEIGKMITQIKKV
tara:strand:+ start:561 stop:824 length:264 start_codon:yes stop_codon:yes gene_type:complete